jgi:hypothetical protein
MTALFEQINWELLRAQKNVLTLICTTDIIDPRVREHLGGLVNLIDHIQDLAVEDGCTSEDVFGEELKCH